MIEKFSDYESVKFLDQEGDFIFTVKSYELKNSAKGDPMAVFEVESDAGKTTIYHTLNPKARWSYNNLISACLKLTPEKKKTFELDYETVGNQLVNTQFVGHVERDFYTKEIKVPQDDGTFIDGVEEKESYKIKSYSMA